MFMDDVVMFCFSAQTKLCNWHWWGI